MNRMELRGEWNNIKGLAKSNWGRLTDDDLLQIEGDYDQLVGRVQKQYGLSLEEARRQVDDWLDSGR